MFWNPLIWSGLNNFIGTMMLGDRQLLWSIEEAMLVYACKASVRWDNGTESRREFTWSPTRKEMPSLVQSSSSCCLIVVSGTIIIVVEPWNIIWSNERRFLWGSERHHSLLFMLKKTQHTWWEEAAGDDHRQCLAHAGWQAAKDVMNNDHPQHWWRQQLYPPAMAVECMQWELWCFW